VGGQGVLGPGPSHRHAPAGVRALHEQLSHESDRVHAKMPPQVLQTVCKELLHSAGER